MEYRDRYNGHVINVWTTANGKDRWAWLFTIADQAMVRSEGRPQLSDEQTILDQAIARAKATIDAYPK